MSRRARPRACGRSAAEHTARPGPRPRPLGRRRIHPRRHLFRTGLPGTLCVTRASAASGRGTSPPAPRPSDAVGGRPGDRGLLQFPPRHGREGGARVLGGRGARDAVPGAGHRGGRGARRGVPRRGPLGPPGLPAAAAPGGGGLRRGGTGHGGSQPVALAADLDRAGDRRAGRGLAGLHHAARAPRGRARGGARGARPQRGGGARARGRDQGDPGRGAPRQPGLERGRVGRCRGRAAHAGACCTATGASPTPAGPCTGEWRS